jgi:CelD/BcsL family acetyltransferase involved in cellulose biosynthesis
LSHFDQTLLREKKKKKRRKKQKKKKKDFKGSIQWYESEIEDKYLEFPLFPLSIVWL